ncbi:MAG TPA: type II toxin-antitoxin system VapC family toxin [Thermoanaerobaculia bacterium]
MRIGTPIGDRRRYARLAVVDLRYRKVVGGSTGGTCSGPVGVSPFTFWEVAMLDRKRRVKLDGPALPWIAEAVDRSHTVTIELSLEIAVIAGSFDHARLRDPADRIIVATALHHGWPLVTKDDDIRAAGVVPTIW